MKIDITVGTYLRYGGLSPYSYIDDLLNAQLKKKYGSAVKTIEIYPRLPVPEPSRPTSSDYFDGWQKALEELPYLAFRRKLYRFELAFCSKHFNASEMDDWSQWDNGKRIVPKISVEAIRLAGDEIKEALQLIRKRIKPSDDFDVGRFLADVEVALNSAPPSIKEWNALAKIAEQEQKTIQDAKDPWERLEIDWDEFHPKAREVLDDPFYWDCLDDISPHGNDTGADLLEDFQQWNKRNSKKSPLTFLEKQSKKTGIEPFEWLVTKKSEVLKIDKERSIEMGIGNESAIALAFAVLKMRASCPLDVVSLAKCGLERKSIIVKASSLEVGIKAEWDVGIKRMRSKLNSLPR
jgi:uncharacterized protein YfeS